jgi:hypothetical protein
MTHVEVATELLVTGAGDVRGSDVRVTGTVHGHRVVLCRAAGVEPWWLGVDGEPQGRVHDAMQLAGRLAVLRLRVHA